MNHPLIERPVGERVVRVWVTDRSDGSVHPDDVDAPTLRRRQVAATGRAWAMTDQVHGVDVVSIDDARPWGRVAGRGDILVTRRHDTQLSVWAADCAPIVLAADDGTLVVAHGGWRGLAAGVVDVAVDCATTHGGAVALAVLGPVIHPCCYEFGADDLDRVAGGLAVPAETVRATTVDGSPALDVPAGITAALARRGVDLDHLGPCTGCDDRWYSHRARLDAGRHAVVIEQVAA